MEREFVEPTEFARTMRTAPTPAERALWNELRASKTGYKFSRQIRIGSYFADFCCRQHRLVVEVDGEAHDRQPEHDLARDRAMRERGYEVLRLKNNEVMEHTSDALARIIAALDARSRFRY